MGQAQTSCQWGWDWARTSDWRFECCGSLDRFLSNGLPVYFDPELPELESHHDSHPPTLTLVAIPHISHATATLAIIPLVVLIFAGCIEFRGARMTEQRADRQEIGWYMLLSTLIDCFREIVCVFAILLVHYLVEAPLCINK